MKRFTLLLLGAFLAGNVFADSASDRRAAAIDRVLEAHWQAAKIAPNPPAGDETFVRRIYLDLAGRIPTVAEAERFLDSADPGKRGALIDELLGRESYASHFFNLWADILRYKSHHVNTSNVIPAAYRRFLRESLRGTNPTTSSCERCSPRRGMPGTIPPSDIISAIPTCRWTTWR